MRRLFLLFLIIPQLAFSQYNAKSFCLETSDEVVSKPIRSSFSQDHEFNLDINSAVSGFAITGKATLENDNDSYIRVLLKDDYNYDHLVYENYPMLADELSIEFNNTAIETIFLNNIIPKSIKIECHHATLEFNSINYIRSKSSTRISALRTDSIMKSQKQYIVEKLNTNLRRHKALWRAGVTSVSEKTFEEKKAMFGGKVPELYGLEYYKGGIFVVPKERDPSNRLNRNRNRDSNAYVSEWDWRNRHGKNWMTSVKDQGDCGACWAFATIGVLESYINLYYNNQSIDYDLSEEELISCSDHGCDGVATLDSAYMYICDNGIVKENCFPYVAHEENCSKCQNPSEIVEMDSYQFVDWIHISDDRMKQQLIKSPLALGHKLWGHAIVVAGYKDIMVGDTINKVICWLEDSIVIDNDSPYLGETAWLIKNSWGEDWGHNGYAYILTSLLFSHFTCPDGKITSLVYDDNSIICEDADGDGYYFWGINDNKPLFCPSWVPDIKDGNDAIYTKGKLLLDNTSIIGELETLNPDGNTTLVISDNTIYTTRRSEYSHIRITSGGNLTVKNILNLFGRVTVTIESGGELVIDGGVMTNADISLAPGGKITLKNGGKLVMRTNTNFSCPIGALADILNGEILRSNEY